MKNLHICTGTNKKYIARARHAGQKKYVLLGKECVAEHTAIRRLTKAMIDKRYRRGDIILVADYYEPVIIFEMVRR